ncbi:MAG: NUMOD3 domain-containing DNA-binding protein [Candidatus Nanopelagicales bacterium]|jgi:hypothetical protein
MKNPNRFYTYAYLREDKTPYYIGKGQGNRAYFKYQKKVKPPKNKFQIIFLKQNLTEQEAFKHEKYMIAVFGRKDLGTGILRNLTDGGEGICGFRHNEEIKKKMSKNRRGKNNPFYGKTHSQETKEGISRRNRGMVSSFLGKKHLEETKKKLSELNKGKFSGDKNPMFGKSHSLEAKNKISEANLGKKRTEEQRKRMSENIRGKNNPFYGKTHSQETKERLRELNIGKVCPEEIKKKISSAHNKLLRFKSPSGDIIEEMTTLRKFCKKYNLPRNGMSKVMKGEQQQSKGWSMPPKKLTH